MDIIPTELVLYLIPFLPLPSLIAIRCINTRWRSLARMAYLIPARKALLDLYLAVIVHPDFQGIVEAVQPHRHHFDREAYITSLKSRGCMLPDVFELWVLEWPSKAVHFLAWPGLPVGTDVELECYCGGNMLADAAPIIHPIPAPTRETGGIETSCQGLALWGVNYGLGVIRLWLVVDANGDMNDRQKGKLLWTHSYDDEPVQILLPMFSVVDDTASLATNFLEFLGFLDHTLGTIASDLESFYFGGVDKYCIEM